MSDAIAKVLVVVVLCLAAFFGYGTWSKHQQRIGYDRAQSEAKVAAEKMAVKVSDLNLQLSNALVERNNKDFTNAKTVSTLSSELSAIRRLRDPNAVCRAAPGPAVGGTSDSDADGTETGGLLSAELTGLLARTQREADEINIAYIASREDGRKMREKGCVP